MILEMSPAARVTDARQARPVDGFTVAERLAIFVVPIFAAALTANYRLHESADGALAETNRRVQMVRSGIARLDAQIAAETRSVEERRAVEEKLAIVEGWKKRGSRSLKMLDELSTVIPPRVWLTEFSESAGAVTLRGDATAFEDLSSFQEKLHGSAYFRDLRITDVQRSQPGTAVQWVMQQRFRSY